MNQPESLINASPQFDPVFDVPTTTFKFENEELFFDYTIKLLSDDSGYKYYVRVIRKRDGKIVHLQDSWCRFCEGPQTIQKLAIELRGKPLEINTETDLRSHLFQFNPERESLWS